MAGWDEATLGEVCEILDRLRKPITKKDRKSGPYPYYGATGIVDYVDDYIFDERLILVGEDGAKWEAGDKTAFFAEGRYWVNNHAHVLRALKKLVRDDWLVYYLNGLDLSGYITGVTVPKLNQTKLRSIPIPVPPLPEQKRIVEVLDAAFAKIDRLETIAKRQIENENAYRETLLDSIFASIEQDIDSNTHPLKDLAILKGRIGWKGLTAKEYTDEGPLFLSVHSLNYGDYVDYRDAFHISQERYDESPEIMLQKDDILICKDGAGIGKLGIVPEIIAPTTINSSLLLIRHADNLRAKYLYYCLLSPYFQKIVQSRLEGATTPHLYQRDIKVLLPMQIAISATVMRRLSKAKPVLKRLHRPPRRLRG